MGEILSTRSSEGKIIFEVDMDYDEALHLKGHIHKVHLFSEETADVKSNISTRGRSESTRYFLIPRDLREGIQFNSKVRCQKIETKSKIVFVFVVDKIRI